MAYSYIRYTGNGTQTDFSFAFPYFSTSNISVTVNGVAAPFTWVNSSTVKITTAPASGAVIFIQRTTPKDITPVNFVDGSVLLEADLDTLALFSLYAAQESIDEAQRSIQLNSVGKWEAQGNPISNLADPTNAQDAVTKNYFESVYTPQMDTKVASATASANTATTKASEASSSATSSAGSASTATTQASIATTKADIATTQANTATTQAGIATTKASEASSSASSAATSSTTSVNAAASALAIYGNTTVMNNAVDTATTSAATATTKASEASTSAASSATSATSSASSATSAASSATSATGSASTATTQAGIATTQAGIATTKASEASASAASALSSKNAAATSETNSAASASSASTSAATATTKASEAASSQTAAASSATSAATSASNAATSASTALTAQSATETARDAALAALDNFDDRYLGQKASDPTVDNDGNALLTGALYFNTTTSAMKVYTGTGWVSAYASLSGALLVTNNLSDLSSAASARTNLGLGSFATKSSALSSDITNFAASASAAAPVQSVAGKTGVVTLAVGDISGAQASLGFTPLNPANNLSEVTAATARTNLGLGSLATKSTVATADITDGAITSAKCATTINGYGTRTVSTSSPTGGSDGDIWYKV